MWRAFFFAVGTMLIILGFECLMFDRFVVQGARIPSVIAKMLDGSETPSPAGQFASSQAQNQGLPNSPNPAVSRFGPSRFNDSFSNSFQAPGNFYGGTPSSNQGSNGNSDFSLAGFGRQVGGVRPLAQPNSGYGPQPNRDSATIQRQVLHPKDWMPWSLLAAGTLVVLYTNTTTKQS